MSDFGRLEHPKGRKQYRCAWCGEEILVGEVHAHYVGVWESEWQDWRMHEECYQDVQDTDEFQDGFTLYDHERPEKVGV